MSLFQEPLSLVPLEEHYRKILIDAPCLPPNDFYRHGTQYNYCWSEYNSISEAIEGLVRYMLHMTENKLPTINQSRRMTFLQFLTEGEDNLLSPASYVRYVNLILDILEKLLTYDFNDPIVSDHITHYCQKLDELCALTDPSLTN